MKTWHDIVLDITKQDEDIKFSFYIPESEGANMTIVVHFPDGSRGSIYQTSGGDWTFS